MKAKERMINSACWEKPKDIIIISIIIEVLIVCNAFM